MINIYKENLKIYNSFNDVISKWIKDNNIQPSELNYETMKQVVDDFGETWYRQSLGKNH